MQSSLVQAQFYVSPRACVLDLTPNTSTGMLEGCANPTYFFDTDTSSTQWTWTFGSPSGTNSPDVITGVRNPQVYFNRADTMTVSLTKVSRTGLTQTVSKKITIGNVPQQPKFNGKLITDTTVCSEKSVTLNPFQNQIVPGRYTYLWFPTGDTTKTITVDTSGCYSVEVFDGLNGCSRTARINVKFCYEQGGGGGGPERWYFGNGATLEFNGSGVIPVRDSLANSGDLFGTPEEDSITFSPSGGGSNPLNTKEATAMIYGPDGGLAFYTDGANLYNGNDEIIVDAAGQGLTTGSASGTQTLAIIPKNSCNSCPYHEYYVLSKDLNTNILSYTVVDMRYNDRRGMITDRAIPLAYDVTDRIGVQSVNNGEAFQIYTHERNSSDAQIISIDSLGINVTGLQLGYPQTEPGASNGYIAFSNDGQKMAQGNVINGENVVEIFSRDPDSGIFQNSITVRLGINAPPNVYGVAFNEDATLLYVTVSGDGETSYLLQLPIFYEDPDLISAGINVIDSSRTEYYGALQLGPVNPQVQGGKFLYMAINNANRMAYIQEPDFLGGAAIVGFIDVNEGIDLSGNSGLGLPTVVYTSQEQGGDGLSATYFGNCFNSNTTLETQGICSPMRNEITWEFEDGTTMKGQNAVYVFPKTGWNKFRVVIKVFNPSPAKRFINSQIINKIIEQTETECTEVVFEDSIYIKPAPVINLPDTANVCTREVPVKYALLDPKVTGGSSFEYLWETALGVALSGNPTDSIQSVIAPATYVLNVVNNFGCAATDEVLVTEGCEPRVFFPDAFTPEGANPGFKVEYAHIEDPNLKIYNRWGELVFETNNLDNQWDGRVRGKVQAPTLYAYVLSYKALDFPERGTIKEVGSVWILK